MTGQTIRHEPDHIQIGDPTATLFILSFHSNNQIPKDYSRLLSTYPLPMNDQASKDSKRYTVLRYLFLSRNRKSACPACLSCRSRYDKVKDHCKVESKKGSESHEGLLAKDFSKFEDSYREAIGYSPEVELRLPKTRSACFDLDTVIQYRSSTHGGHSKYKFDLLLQAAERSAMDYICPHDFATFPSMQALRGHWEKKPGAE